MVCITDVSISQIKLSDITVGVVYEIVEEVNFNHPKIIQIKDDTGQLRWYLKSNFISLDKYRENQLNKLI